MKIAAIQHRLRGNAEEDVRALADAAIGASANGAEVIILPDVPSLHADDGAGFAVLSQLLEETPAFCIVPNIDLASCGVAVVAALPAPVSAPGGGLGSMALVVGDSCMDAQELSRVAEQTPSFAVLSPRSETDLQAEAMLEFAIELSDSLSGVIIIAECAGAEALAIGHGGSAIVILGEVVAEALSDDDVLVAEVALPFPLPSPREPLPQVPPLLAQRVAHHRGEVAIEHGADVS